MTRHYSYSALLRQRTVVAALTLGLVTVMTGLGIELSMTAQKTTISASVQRLIQPLDPLIDLKTIQQLETYQPLSLNEAKGFVQQQLNRPQTQIETRAPDAPIQIGAPVVASPSGEVVLDAQAPTQDALEPELLFPEQPSEQP